VVVPNAEGDQSWREAGAVRHEYQPRARSRPGCGTILAAAHLELRSAVATLAATRSAHPLASASVAVPGSSTVAAVRGRDASRIAAARGIGAAIPGELCFQRRLRLVRIEPQRQR